VDVRVVTGGSGRSGGAGDDSPGGVLIDLGELPSVGARRMGRAVTGRPPRAYRTILAVLTVVLVAALGAAGYTAPPAPPVVIPARLGDMMVVGADRFYVISAGPEVAGSVVQNKIVSTYGLPDGRLLSLTTVAVSGAIFDVTSVGGTVLVSYQVDTVGTEATVALRAGTGTALWRRPARLLGVSTADGLVLLRENSPQFGNLHWYGMDLATGELRWQLEQPVRGYITETGYTGGFPSRLIVVDLTGRLEVRDSGTGRVVAAATIAVPGDWARRGIALWPDGELILVGDHSGATAYALPDLTRRWRTPVDLYTSYIGPSCGDAVCFFSPRSGGMLVVDRGTGQRRWSSDRWSYADQVGPYLLAGADAQTGGSQTLSVVDTRTGRVRGDFGSWQSIGPPDADGTVIGLRSQPVGDTVFYARLDPVKLTTRILGVARHVSGDCQTTDGVLVCRRTDASVGIWRLTGK
jgi:outer membrane protein assembly factor BamB